MVKLQPDVLTATNSSTRKQEMEADLRADNSANAGPACSQESPGQGFTLMTTTVITGSGKAKQHLHHCIMYLDFAKLNLLSFFF